MTPKAVLALERWTVSPGFRSQSVAEAAKWLGELLPNYPDADDDPVEICEMGFRWFREEMEAFADAIYRAGRAPDADDCFMTGGIWARKRDGSGLWTIPASAQDCSIAQRVARLRARKPG